MSEIDVFSNPLAMHVFGCLTFGLIALQIEVASYVAKREPQRLPPSIVRRAL